MDDLTKRHCIPCRGDVARLSADEIRPLAAQVPKWTVSAERRIERDYGFVDFRHALAFVVRVGELAEQEGHHPDIRLTWGAVGIELFTHAIDGLTESDFVLAAKIEALFKDAPGRKV